MFIYILKTCALYALWWGGWKVIRQYFLKTALDNIPGPAKSWKGVFPDVFNVNAWDYHRQMTETYGSVIKIKALLGENQLYVFDPKALYHICVKDQHVYEAISANIEGNRIILGHGLLGTLGDQHRKQRKMLNPVFSIARMRGLVPIFYEVAYELRDALLNRVKKGVKEIDLLLWTRRTALELIGRSGLGYSFDSLRDDTPAHPYSISVKRLIPIWFKIAFLRTYLLSILNLASASGHYRYYAQYFGPSSGIEKKALMEGDEAVEQQVGQGKDILSILLRANMKALDTDRLSDEEVLAQFSTMIFAATDTTSGALSRILHLLAIHPAIQDQLRQEIVTARETLGGDLSYDQLVSLPYLDAVCRETLRLYAPLSVVTRTTRRDVVLPLSKPIRGVDGKEISEIPIPNNTNILVGIMASNRNPELWGPDSYEWKPERWLKPLPETVISAHIPGIYSNLMTFLDGGRACIGFKFSQLEMKVVLSVLLESFRFSLSEEKIVWQMNGIATPTTHDVTNTHNQLPLVVESLK